jgi:hypothetical protein
MCCVLGVTVFPVNTELLCLAIVHPTPLKKWSEVIWAMAMFHHLMIGNQRDEARLGPLAVALALALVSCSWPWPRGLLASALVSWPWPWPWSLVLGLGVGLGLVLCPCLGLGIGLGLALISVLYKE